MTEADAMCPACGTEAGYEPDVLAPGQRWCPNPDCRVRTFHETVTASE